MACAVTSMRSEADGHRVLRVCVLLQPLQSQLLIYQWLCLSPLVINSKLHGWLLLKLGVAIRRALKGSQITKQTPQPTQRLDPPNYTLCLNYFWWCQRLAPCLLDRNQAPPKLPILSALTMVQFLPVSSGVFLLTYLHHPHQATQARETKALF